MALPRGREKIIETTYGDWLKVAYEGLRQLVAAGIVAERIDVRVADLVAWCRDHGRPLDAEARFAFAAEVLRKRHEGSGTRRSS